MKWLVVLLLGSSAYAAAKFDKSSLENAPLPAGIVANKFIIEIAPPPNARRDVVSREVGPSAVLPFRLFTRFIGQAHESLYHHLRRRDVSFLIDKEYNSPDIFVGASVTLEVRSVLMWRIGRLIIMVR